MKFVRILMFLSMLPLAVPGLGELVNVLELGVKNDGSVDISEIVNAASKTKALFFPAGRYRVAKPLWLANPIRGEGYSRGYTVDDTRTWFISELSCTNCEVGVINVADDLGRASINIEDLNICCRSAECGIRIRCAQYPMVFVSRIGVFNLGGTGLWVEGRGSRSVFAQDMTIFSATNHPPHCTGLKIISVCDARVSNIEAMGVRYGLEVWNGHLYGDNLHLWTGCMGQIDDGSWWNGTRGIVLGANTHFSGSQIYPDTCFYAIEQVGTGGFCDISNVMYWEDDSIKIAPDRGGEFYHVRPGAQGRLLVHGGSVGVSGGNGAKEQLGWMTKVYSPAARMTDVRLLSDWPIVATNIDRLCLGGELPDYTVEYAERGWCKVADILGAAATGACAATLSLADGATWKVTVVRQGGKTKTEFKALNRLCRKHQVKAVEEFETIRIFVLNESAEPTRMRFMTEYMGDYFRPVDHGTLRTIDGQVRYREVRAEL